MSVKSTDSGSPVQVPPSGPLEAELARLQLGDHTVAIAPLNRRPESMNAALMAAVRACNPTQVAELFRQPVPPTPTTVANARQYASHLGCSSFDDLEGLSPDLQARMHANYQIKHLLTRQLPPSHSTK
jgi:hypothetical protein